MTIFLETKRLIVKTPSFNDFSFISKLESDPEVMLHITGKPYTIDESKANLTKAMEHQYKHGFSFGTVFEKVSDEFVGQAGLMHLGFDDTQPEIEVSYRLASAFWNKGYGTELTHNLLNWGFQHINTGMFIAVLNSENTRSKRVLEKVGMEYMGPALYQGRRAQRYEIERDDFNYSHKPITFKLLSLTDLPTLTNWFNTQHVQNFYSLRQWSEKEIFEKYSMYIKGEKPVTAYIVAHEYQPIGYVQWYHLSDFPLANAVLPEDVMMDGVGMDMLIGEERLIGKGIGSQIIKTFLHEIIWPYFKYCVVDIAVENKMAIRSYEKAGFNLLKILTLQNQRRKNSQFQLMIINK